MGQKHGKTCWRKSGNRFQEPQHGCYSRSWRKHLSRYPLRTQLWVFWRRSFPGKRNSKTIYIRRAVQRCYCHHQAFCRQQHGMGTHGRKFQRCPPYFEWNLSHHFPQSCERGKSGSCYGQLQSALRTSHYRKPLPQYWFAAKEMGIPRNCNERLGCGSLYCGYGKRRSRSRNA